MVSRFNLIYGVVFLYFLFVSADVLHVEVGLFKVKFGNVIALFALFLLILFRKPFVLTKEIFLPFLAILGSMLLSATQSQAPLRSFGYVAVYFYDFACYFLLPISFLFVLDQQKVIKLYFASYLCIGTYAALQLLLSALGVAIPLARQHIGSVVRPHALSYEPSFYALYMTAFVMFYTMQFLLGEKRKIWPFFWVNVLLLISTSTGAFYAYLFFIPICCAFSKFIPDFSKRMRRLLGVFCLFFGAGALLFNELFRRTFFKFFVTGHFLHYSFSERWEGIVNSWRVFCSHPWFGVGVGGIGPYLFYTYNPTAGSLNLSEVELYDPKNVATEIMASLGIVGTVSFLFLWYCFFRIFRNTMKCTGIESRERGIALSLFVSLIVQMAALQFNPGLFRSYIWLHAGIVIGYLLKIRRTYAH